MSHSIITAKYESTCRDCGGLILPGMTINYHRQARRGNKTAHASCKDATAGAQGPSVVVTRFSSGAEIYRNSAGRCEDAPCCGCCS